MKQSAGVSGSRLVLVLDRTYRSLVELLERGLALQGISFTDFAILEALLHKGPLAGSVIGARIVQLPNAATKPAIGRLIRRGLLRRQTSGNGSMTEVFELTEEGRRKITKIYAEQSHCSPCCRSEACSGTTSAARRALSRFENRRPVA